MQGRMMTKLVEVFFLEGRKANGIIKTTFRGSFHLGDEKCMHTLETAVVLPLLLFVLLGGVFLSLQSVTLIAKQNQRYAHTSVDSASCVQVLRITEVVYETIESFTES